MTFHIPLWLFRLFGGGKGLADLEQRATVTGKASRSVKRTFGPVTFERNTTIEFLPKDEP